jgi:hypothetical protein
MFGEEVPAVSTDPVMGLQVELPDACPQCQGNVASVGQGVAPHRASLRCITCRRHRGWMSLVSYTFLSEIAKKFGRPDAPIKVRRGNWQPDNEQI